MFFSDVPHLFKNIRNYLHDKKISESNKIIIEYK